MSNDFLHRASLAASESIGAGQRDRAVGARRSQSASGASVSACPRVSVGSRIRVSSAQRVTPSEFGSVAAISERLSSRFGHQTVSCDWPGDYPARRRAFCAVNSSSDRMTSSRTAASLRSCLGTPCVAPGVAPRRRRQSALENYPTISNRVGQLHRPSLPRRPQARAPYERGLLGTDVGRASYGLRHCGRENVGSQERTAEPHTPAGVVVMELGHAEGDQPLAVGVGSGDVRNE